MFEVNTLSGAGWMEELLKGLTGWCGGSVV